MYTICIEGDFVKLTVKKILEICNGSLLCGNDQLVIESYSKDTRTIQKGDCYVGIKGESFDGNTFWKEAIEKGASACLLDSFQGKIDDETNYTILLVEDSVKALQDLATSTAQSFNARYTESLIDDTTNDIYGNILGVSFGYDFTKPGAYEISSSLADELYITEASYKLGSTTDEVTPTNITTSIVIFDGNNPIVCLITNPSSDYYVSNNKNDSVTIDSTTYTFKSTEADENDVMWACSNDKNSWE